MRKSSMAGKPLPATPPAMENKNKNQNVSVALGGRWNKFKTYSTIQCSLEIWAFVITFVFKWWLNKQKFMYKGGVTELKKHQKRKSLAKWLKEGLLRLGPTFIKIGSSPTLSFGDCCKNRGRRVRQAC